MNQGHIESGEVVNLETLKSDMDVDASYAIVKTADMEVIRMALQTGKEIVEHQVEGELSVQCLKGDITFTVNGTPRELQENDWIFLKKNQRFSYSVHKNTILLLTILFN